jgi:hypothetical protein
MGETFDMKSDAGADDVNAGGGVADADYGGDLASDDGFDLNPDTNTGNIVADNIVTEEQPADTNSDVSPEIGNDISSNTTPDNGRDLANETDSNNAVNTDTTGMPETETISETTSEDSNESALSRILTAGKGASSPSELAQLIVGVASVAPGTKDVVAPGTEGVLAQALDRGGRMGSVFSEEFMAGVIRQHGPGPAAILQNMKIQQAIESIHGEPLKDNEPVYDENGIDLTDEKYA